MLRKKIIFIKAGNFSHLNKFVYEALSKEFSEYYIEVCDVKDDLVHPFSILNLLHILKEYGKDILLGKKQIINCQIKNTYMFRKIKERVNRKFGKGDYLFTFQTQSLFDASVKGIPHFVYTDHTHLANLYYPQFDKRKIFSKAWIDLERSIYRNAYLNFTMSSNISKSLEEHYQIDSTKIKCVYAGSNVQENEEYFNSFSNKNILFVGVDWERKGGPLLISAFKRVLQVHSDATLTIVGCSPDLDLPNCSVVGRIPLSEVAPYYKKASIFCLPTNLEPFGIVFLEASTYKLPIIGTNIGAIPDMVTDAETGYLINPNDQDMLEKRLIDLLNSPEKCKAFGEKGYKQNKEKYNWQAVGKELRKNIDREIFPHKEYD